MVLGLVTTKLGELESKDDVKRRLDEAARYVPLEQLVALVYRENPERHDAGYEPDERDEQRRQNAAEGGDALPGAEEERAEQRGLAREEAIHRRARDAGAERHIVHVQPRQAADGHAVRRRDQDPGEGDAVLPQAARPVAHCPCR